MHLLCVVLIVDSVLVYPGVAATQLELPSSFSFFSELVSAIKA
jgi:hypothetical protein